MSWQHYRRAKRDKYGDILLSRTRVFARLDDKRIVLFSATNRLLVVYVESWQNLHGGDLHAPLLLPKAPAFDGHAWDLWTLLEIIEELK